MIAAAGVIGVWLALWMPTQMGAPGCVPGPSALPATERLLSWVAFRYDSLQAGDSTRYYNLGWHAAAESVMVPLVTPRAGIARVCVTSMRESNQAWGCWSGWMYVSCGEIAIAGDLNGDGQVSLPDIAVIAELQARSKGGFWPVPLSGVPPPR